jgi:hypothetical protein
MNFKYIGKKCLETIAAGAVATGILVSTLTNEAKAGLILREKFYTTNNVEVTNGILTNNIPYILKLQLDSRNVDSSIITNKMIGGDWSIEVATQYIDSNSIVASIPVKIDFWNSYTMSKNIIDNTLDGDLLDGNHRLVSGGKNGPTNTFGFIEDIHFTPYATTPTSITNLFDLYGVQFKDAKNNPYNIANTNNNGIYLLSIEQPNMLIVNQIPEPSTAGMVATGAGIAAYLGRRRKKNEIYSRNHSDARNTGRKS